MAAPQQQQSDELVAGHELDAEVARRVFGFWLEPDFDGRLAWFGPHPVTPNAKAYASCTEGMDLQGQSYRSQDGLIKFSTDWPAAWCVVRKMNERFSTRHFFVEALRPLMPKADRPMDPSWWIFYLTPEIICRAALQALRAAAGEERA